jgi:alginate production protein
MTTYLKRFTLLIWLLPLWHTTGTAQTESSAGVLTAGHWVEVRGSYQRDGNFLAQRVELVQPEDNEVLIGTITGVPERGYFILLGMRVRAQEKARFDKVDRNALQGVRVKVEGHFRYARNFSARKIRSRGEGRDRIIGRIDDIRRTRDGLEISIMGFGVRIPENLPVRHDARVSRYVHSAARAQVIVDRDRDEDDLFGKGLWLGDKLMLAGQLQTRGTVENDFDLDQNIPTNRFDFENTIRARLIYQATDSFFAVVGMNHRQLLRNRDLGGTTNVGDTWLAETYLYWLNIFGSAVDLQVGRVDFDDQREWLYDQNLDTLRAIWSGENIRAELSYSETLSHGNVIDEAASNSMLYISNNDEDRHLAAYVIHRDFDLPISVQRTHVGLRALGDWLPGQESWVELAYMSGKTNQVDDRGWAFDIGSTWSIRGRFFVTLGYAFGQGDDPASNTNDTFRQTGLQDNNGKLSGVMSFRYYGELLDPELANLEILTAGLGLRFNNPTSLDLVWHGYQQNELSTSLVDADIVAQPNGLDTDLGTEVDVVLGWRTRRHWDLEAVAAWFSPGEAFVNADNAFLAKLQVRYRF